MQKQTKLIRNRKGFTLVEIIIVIMIIGVLTVGALPGFLQSTRLEKFRNKVNKVVSMLEEARTQALASELDENKKIPPGGYGVYFDFENENNQRVVLFIDDWNDDDSKDVNMNYFETTNRVIPDGKFTNTGNPSTSDTIVDILEINTPRYIGFGKIYGDEIASDGSLSDWNKGVGESAETITIIFTPPYAETTIVGSDDDETEVELQTVDAKFDLKVGNISRKIRLNRITTTAEIYECVNTTICLPN